MYSGYGITFDSGGSWSFDNGTSSHIGNCKYNFLILGLGPTYGINGKFGSAEKTFSTEFTL